MSIITFTTSGAPSVQASTPRITDVNDKKPNDVAVGTGISYPLSTNSRLEYESKTGSSLLTNQVIYLLSTRRASVSTKSSSVRFPGDLKSTPMYGSLLWTLKQRPTNQATLDLARVRTREALAIWLPQVEVLAIRTSYANRDASMLRIELEFKYKGTEETPLALSVKLKVAA